MQGNKNRKYLKWNPEMDNSLREFYPDSNWEVIAKRMNKRFGLNITAKKCFDRWVSCAGPNPRRGKKFTPEEDELLTNLVGQYGETDWKLIAEKMTGRNTRQCRERWKNYLGRNRDINSRKFTSEEDQLLMQKYNELGPKWEQIAKFFQARTPERLKNRYRFISHSKNLNYNRMQQICVPVFVPVLPIQQISPICASISQTITNNEKEDIPPLFSIEYLLK